MQSSLSSARDRKTDFAPRTGGNRYKVVKPDISPSIMDKSEAEISKEIDKNAEQSAGKGGQTKKSGFNTDFLLARALQSSVQMQEKRGVEEHQAIGQPQKAPGSFTEQRVRHGSSVGTPAP